MNTKKRGRRKKEREGKGIGQRKGRGRLKEEEEEEGEDKVTISLPIHPVAEGMIGAGGGIYGREMKIASEPSNALTFAPLSNNLNPIPNDTPHNQEGKKE